MTENHYLLCQDERCVWSACVDWRKYKSELQTLRTALAESQAREMKLRKAIDDANEMLTKNDPQWDTITDVLMGALSSTPTPDVGVALSQKALAVIEMGRDLFTSVQSLHYKNELDADLDLERDNFERAWRAYDEERKRK
jgi:hypothetical protein